MDFHYEDLKIRPMLPKDLNQVHDIFKTSIKSYWSIDELMNEFTNEVAFYLVATYNEEVIGFCGAWIVLEEVQITNIAIKENYRKLGIGEILLKEFIKKSSEKGGDVVYLEVRVSNNTAISFYNKLGFLKMGVRKKFYSDKEDALLMYYPIN